MDSWLRIAIFALILLSFLRRILKVKAQRRPPSPTMQGSPVPPTARVRSGRKNDFRDVPPPPENPELG